MDNIDKKILNQLLQIYPDKNYSLSELKLNYPTLYKKILRFSKYRSLTPTHYLRTLGFQKNFTQINLNSDANESYDMFTINRLLDSFYINQSDLSKILNCSKNNINLKMKKSSNFDKEKWLVSFDEYEIREINKFINNGKDEYYSDNFSFKIIHKNNNFYDKAIILRNNKTIKVNFAIPFEIKDSLEKTGLNKCSTNELIALKNIDKIWSEKWNKYENGKKIIYLSAKQKNVFRPFAKLKGEEIDNYFYKLGYVWKDSRVVSDDEIISKIKLYADENNHIHLGYKDDDYYFFTSIANRHKPKLTISELFKKYGYTYERGHKNYSDKSTEERHKEIIERNYIVHDKYIYIPSQDQFYSNLTTYARKYKNQSLDDIISQYGYIRLRKKDLPKDYIPYDYTNDLALKSKFDDELIRSSLHKISNSNNEVFLDVSTYFYYTLLLKAKIDKININELISKYGFKRIYHPINNILNDESKKIDIEFSNIYGDSYVKEKIIELNKLESKYTVRTSSEERIERNVKLVATLKELYQGKCQLCNPNNHIPYICKEDGSLYSEVHHINSIHNATCDDDINFIDSYKNTIVLCPFHHKYVHYHNGGFKHLVKLNNILYLENDKKERLRIYTNYHLDI